MRIRLAVPDQLDDKERKLALNHALEAVTIANSAMMKRGLVPKISGFIKAGKVKWKPEPPGDEHFDLASTVIQRGWGDCDDLAPAYAGQLRATGQDPGARAFVKRSGPTRWHALVRRSDGTIVDPSRAAGMGHSVSGAGPIAPSFCRPMTDDPRLCIAIRKHPKLGQWFARCDVPDRADPYAWSSNAHHPNPRTALLSAIQGARHVAGDDIDEDDDARLAVFQDLVNGADPYELIDQLEEDDEDDVTRLVLDGVLSLSGLEQAVGGFDPFGAAVRAAMPGASGSAPTAGKAPIDRWPGDAAHLGQVFWRYARGEQPIEKGGKNYTAQELKYATINENAYRATLTPEALAARKAMFAREGNQAHQARREARQFGNVLKSGLATALPVASMALPFVPGVGPLAAAALGLATPMLTSALRGGSPLAALASPGGALSALTSMVPGGGGGASFGGSQIANELMAMLTGTGGNAPPTQRQERGVVARPFGQLGPALMRF
jgi:hypothetical protein